MNVKYYLVMIPCSVNRKNIFFNIIYYRKTVHLYLLTQTGTFNGTHFYGYTLCKTDSLAQHIYVKYEE